MMSVGFSTFGRAATSAAKTLVASVTAELAGHTPVPRLVIDPGLSLATATAVGSKNALLTADASCPVKIVCNACSVPLTAVFISSAVTVTIAATLNGATVADVKLNAIARLVRPCCVHKFAGAAAGV